MGKKTQVLVKLSLLRFRSPFCVKVKTRLLLSSTMSGLIQTVMTLEQKA